MAKSGHSTASTEPDEFDKTRIDVKISMKKSQLYLESQGCNFVSRRERYNKLLSIYEKESQSDKLELANFQTWAIDIADIAIKAFIAK